MRHVPPEVRRAGERVASRLVATALSNAFSDAERGISAAAAATSSTVTQIVSNNTDHPLEVSSLSNHNKQCGDADVSLKETHQSEEFGNRKSPKIPNCLNSDSSMLQNCQSVDLACDQRKIKTCESGQFTTITNDDSTNNSSKLVEEFSSHLPSSSSQHSCNGDNTLLSCDCKELTLKCHRKIEKLDTVDDNNAAVISPAVVLKDNINLTDSSLNQS